MSASGIGASMSSVYAVYKYSHRVETDTCRIGPDAVLALLMYLAA